MIITLDTDFYTQQAFDNMVSEFSDYIRVERAEGNEMCLKMSVQEEFQAESTLIIHTFLNNFLEQSIQDIMSHER